MGSDGCSIFRLSWLGHQSRFDLAPSAVCVNGHFASVDICSLLWSVGRRHPLRADAGRLPVSRHGPQLLFRREPGAVRPSPPPRQQARHPPLIQRLALAADARSAQRVLGGGDRLRRGRREGRLQSWSYPAHHGEKLLAAVRAEIGHTVGRSRIVHRLTPSFCGGKACCFSATWLVDDHEPINTWAPRLDTAGGSLADLTSTAVYSSRPRAVSNA